jgi:pimeloyl-ACP methyl ester carboxylesterase
VSLEQRRQLVVLERSELEHERRARAHVLAMSPTAEASWYEDVGHAPHLEEPERFNLELAALTTRVRA